MPRLADERSGTTPVQLAQLRAFVTVAGLGSLTAAAERLGYTEPAVHLQLRALAQAMGGSLFHRSQRRMELTSLGAMLLPHAKAALGAVSEMAVHASRHRAIESRVVRVGVGRSTGSYLFPHLAAAVKQRYPELVLEPSLMSVGEIYQQLASGDLDVGYASSLRQVSDVSDANRQIVTVPFRKYHWWLVASPRLAAQISGRDGETVHVILPEYASGIIPVLRSLLPGDLNAVFTLAQDTEASKSAGLADLGVACVPAYTAGFELAAGNLVHAFPGLPPPSSTIYVGHERPPRHPSVALVVESTRRLPHFSPDGLPPR